MRRKEMTSVSFGKVNTPPSNIPKCSGMILRRNDVTTGFGKVSLYIGTYCIVGGGFG